MQQQLEKKTTKRKKFKGISRIDSRSTHGWYARVYRPRRDSKLFSDRKYGGKEEALEAAKHWIKERTPKSLPPITQGYPYPYFQTIPANNTSGRLGVTVTFSRYGWGKRFGTEMLLFGVHYREHGRVKTRSVYPSRFPSTEAAFLDACLFRKAYEDSCGGLMVVPRKRIRRRYEPPSPTIVRSRFQKSSSDEFQEKLRLPSPKILVIPGSKKIIPHLKREGFGSDSTFYWRDEVLTMLYEQTDMSFHEGQFAITIWI